MSHKARQNAADGPGATIRPLAGHRGRSSPTPRKRRHAPGFTVRVTAEAAYRVRIWPGELAGDDGRPAAGLWVWVDGTIWISHRVPAGKRLEVFIHELRHAWQYHVGVPADSEGDANNAAAFYLMVHRQLERNGGEAALRTLTAERPAQATRPPAAGPGPGARARRRSARL